MDSGTVVVPMKSDSGSRAIGIDLASGTIGGIAQLCVGHPFDTVKVTIQGSAQKISPFEASKRILAAQGVRGFYKGLGPPMATVAVFNALLFSTTGYLNRLIRPDGGTLTPSEAALTGGLAGIPVSILATPTELLKCRLQAQGGARPPPGVVYTLADAQAGSVLYSGPLNAMSLVLKFEGGVLGMFRGLAPTLLREIPGNAAYFGAYALIKKKLAEAQGLNSTSELGTGSLMIAGGVAGPAFWVPVLPVDVVKTRIQLDSPFKKAFNGMLDCARQVVKADGWAGLMRGWQPCIARSVPANAVVFVVYEAVQKALSTHLP